jgi:RNA polymerase sigma factor (sigma-70 family)
MADLENHALPPATNDSWRTWLMTGTRRRPIDRRRVRGAHKGLKSMMVEGTRPTAERPDGWKEFSDALVRQSVGEAVGELPPRDAQVVKLAYFGGMSNHDIADRLGLSVAAVERGLRQAIARISHHVETGRALGRRATGAVFVWLSGRWLGDSVHQAVQLGAVAAAAGIIAAYPAPLDRSGGAAPPAPPAQMVVSPVHGGTVMVTYAPPSPPSLVPVSAAAIPPVTLPVPLPVPLPRVQIRAPGQLALRP